MTHENRTASNAKSPNKPALPLRMAVDIRFVGAIIGQGGSNIKEIVKESEARCSVDPKPSFYDENGQPYKIVTINGNPEKCSKACIKILEKMEQEATKDAVNHDTNDHELKLRVQQGLIGRLIGKGGKNIKEFMQETGCHISVADDYCVSGMVPIGDTLEKTIRIRGPTLDALGKAEEKISKKLEQCIDQVLANNPYAQAQGFPASNAYAMSQHLPSAAVTAGLANAYYPHGGAGSISQGGYPISGAGLSAGGQARFNGVGGLASHQLYQAAQQAVPGSRQMRPPYPPPGGSAMAAAQLAAAAYARPIPVPPPAQPAAVEVVRVQVPAQYVGPLVGPKGARIRDAIQMSGADIHVESRKDKAIKEANAQDGSGKDSDSNVTIVGTPDAQHRALYWVFQRVGQQSRAFEHTQLTIEVTVPKRLTGAIIGSGGSNIRQLQQTSSAQIKIVSTGPAGAGHAQNSHAYHNEHSQSPHQAGAESDDSVVRITGTFWACQTVQTHLRQYVGSYYHQMRSGVVNLLSPPATTPVTAAGIYGGGNYAYASYRS